MKGNGYVMVTDDWCVATRPLAGDIPAPQLRTGYSLQHVVSGTAVERRIAHRADLTVDDYEKLRSAPGYDPSLDLVAVSAAGDVAAYCICWLDPRSREGEIEPLGTRPEHRPRGLGRAVVLEALRRMQAAGVRQAMVCYDRENLPAERLYSSLGFHLDARVNAYTRDLAGAVSTWPANLLIPRPRPVQVMCPTPRRGDLLRRGRRPGRLPTEGRGARRPHGRPTHRARRVHAHLPVYRRPWGPPHRAVRGRAGGGGVQ